MTIIDLRDGLSVEAGCARDNLQCSKALRRFLDGASRVSIVPQQCITRLQQVVDALEVVSSLAAFHDAVAGFTQWILESRQPERLGTPILNSQSDDDSYST